MNIEQLRRLAGREEVDYPFLMSALKDYANPRDKVSGWIKSGDLIRVKKGLYVFGAEVAQLPYSHEVLANLIYGPSVISLSYALAYYGLIPEKVSTVTSVNSKRNKHFKTAVGEYSYSYLNIKKYAVGVTTQTVSPTQRFIIATPEKALCDYLHIHDKKIAIKNIREMQHYLVEDLRMDLEQLNKLSVKSLREIALVYNDNRLMLLVELLKEWEE